MDRLQLYTPKASTNSRISADKLYDAINNGELPRDLQTILDYGFNHFASRMDQYRLLGVYQGLQARKISSHELHQWQAQGSLVANIVRTYERHSPHIQDHHHYPWFLHNKHLLDPTATQAHVLQTFFDQVIHHLEAPGDHGYHHHQQQQQEQPQQQPSSDLLPASKRESLLFYAEMSHGARPRAEAPWWLKLGFCVCHDADEEGQLAAVCRRLLFGDRFYGEGRIRVGARTTCTFSEFEGAYASFSSSSPAGNGNGDGNGRGSSRSSSSNKTMAQLLRSKAAFRSLLPHEMELAARLDGFFAKRDLAVWRLKAFLRIEDRADVPPDVLQVAVQYGFARCRSRWEEESLKDVYRRLLRAAGPLAVNGVCLRGTLFAFAQCRVEVQGWIRPLMG